MSKFQLQKPNKGWRAGIRSFLHRYEKPLMILIASAGLTAILLHLEFNLLEAGLYDLKVRSLLPSPASHEIVLVTLDDQTVKELEQPAPLSLDIHAQFMEALERLEPRAVGYLIDLNHVHQINPELFQGEWPKRFLKAASRLQSQGTTVLLGTAFDITGEVVPPPPFNSLPHSIAVIHKDGNVFSEDHVTRRALVSFNDKTAFHVDFAERMGLIPSHTSPRGTFSVPEIDSKYFFFRYRQETIMQPKQKATPPYERISFNEILNGKLPEHALRGKILLVGTLLHESPMDFTYTPYSKARFTNPKLLIHANILDSVIRNDGIALSPSWLNAALTFTSVALVFWWVLQFTPLFGVFLTFALAVTVMALCHLALQCNGVWIRESQPLVAILVGYYLAVPYRLFREYKKRWEYQRKNEILTQVEELKRNFLNLVTHDLKTPVARIQGLAEVLLRKANERLLDRDKETLHHIVRSTDELNHFISSILELSKVESQRLNLKTESKDINQLIERCVEGFKAPARARKIKIQLQLEPLFPIRMDVSLISKVMNNLVDNAIKYSPPESEIHVLSRESGEWVEIIIRDEGIGMTAEEKENLFTRFYRAKNDRTAEISGTGLGLYLTKYFIEAHGGHVEVESAKSIGSAFMIRLPIHGAPSGAFVEPQSGLTRKLTSLVKTVSSTGGE